MIIAAIPCPSISVNYSNGINISGFFLDTRIISCGPGFGVNGTNQTQFSINCEETGTWLNISQCDSK